METYCVNCKKFTENENSSVRKTKQNILMLSSIYSVYGKRKSTFIKDKELHNFAKFKMNKIINKFYSLQTNLCHNCRIPFKTDRIYL